VVFHAFILYYSTFFVNNYLTNNDRWLKHPQHYSLLAAFPVNARYSWNIPKIQSKHPKNILKRSGIFTESTRNIQISAKCSIVYPYFEYSRNILSTFIKNIRRISHVYSTYIFRMIYYTIKIILRKRFYKII